MLDQHSSMCWWCAGVLGDESSTLTTAALGSGLIGASSTSTSALLLDAPVPLDTALHLEQTQAIIHALGEFGREQCLYAARPEQGADGGLVERARLPLRGLAASARPTPTRLVSVVAGDVCKHVKGRA